VIAPDIGEVEWDGFGRGPQLIEAVEAAVLPEIQSWFPVVQAQPLEEAA
jgi:hypothetical protein